MKKITTLLCAVLFSALSLAQTPIYLSYKSLHENNLDVAMLTILMDISTINVELKGDLKGKKAIITEHIVNGSEVKTYKLPSYSPASNSTTSIKAMSRLISDKKIRIFIAVDGSYIWLKELDVNNAGDYILMETELDDTMHQDIPIFGCTKGTDTPDRQYCNVRDSKVHPKDWNKELGLTNYIYYTINFTDSDTE